MEKPTHWFIRVGDGNNFKASIKHKLWALKSTASYGKNFLKDAEAGDIMWFLTNWKAGKKLVGMATFVEYRSRELGPLIAVSRTNEELGWENGDWDTEVHFRDLYLIDKLNLEPNATFQSSILKTSSTTCKINFDLEHANIVRYSQTEKV